MNKKIEEAVLVLAVVDGRIEVLKSRHRTTGAISLDDAIKELAWAVRPTVTDLIGQPDGEPR